MIPKEDAQKITRWAQELDDGISIDLIVTQDERSGTFRDFCDHLTRMAPNIKVKTEKDEESIFPAIQVDNIRYQAIPGNKMLEPFLNVLADRDTPNSNVKASVRNKLFNNRIPAWLKIYTMPHCPFCPKTVAEFLPLARGNPSIKLTLIDGALFPDMAASDNIHSAPTVLLEDQFRWTGSIRIEEVVDMILNRDPAQLSSASLKAMFEEGGAVAVANMMLDRKEIFPAFMDLLVHEKWPVRLAAMVVFETIAEENRRLAGQTIPFLWDCFSRAEDTVKGDILYLLGNAGDKKVIPRIETLLNGPYSVEVIDAAKEALEALK
jgi:alkyl hydroperoxide reductase subunit AhpF